MTRLVSHDSWVWWDSMGAIPRARRSVFGPRSTVDDAVRGETRRGGRRSRSSNRRGDARGGLERARAALIDLISIASTDGRLIATAARASRSSIDARERSRR